jgi:hypothetical protein
MGLEAGATDITVDPLPFGLEYAELRGVRIRGRLIDVLIEEDAVTFTVDGVKTLGAIGVPLQFATPSSG